MNKANFAVSTENSTAEAGNSVSGYGAYRRTLADEPIWHIAGNRTGTSVLTRLPGTHIYYTLTVTT